MPTSNRPATTPELHLTAQAHIDLAAGEAAGTTLPRFRMVAYTGVPMRVAGWRHPVVLDLAGLSIPSQSRPIRFGHDPLAGVIDISGPFGLVQVVSFAGRLPAAIADALEGEDLRVRPGSNLRLVPLPQLVALKLYAGGSKSKADIAELLRRNPEADLAAVRKACRRYRLGGLEPLIRESRT